MKSSRRRPRLHVVVGATVASLLLGGSPAVSVGAAAEGSRQARPPGAHQVVARPEVRPNIVQFLVDDMRVDDLRWMPKTRRLMQAGGVDFENGVSPHPLCCPARAELLTGQYAQNSGVQHNQGKTGGYPALRTGSTIATWMSRQGYRTGFIGKHLNRYQEFDRRDPGWDYFKPLTNNVYGYERSQFFGERRDAGYVTTAIAERTHEAIRRFSRQRQPFLLMVNHVAPHARLVREVDVPPVPAPKYRNAFADAVPTPYAAPDFNERDMGDKVGRARQRSRVPRSKVRTWFLARIRSLASVDDAVASTVRTLRARGELDRTFLVFTSDNGMAMGEHRYFGKNELSDEILRVPFLLRGPGVAPGAVDSRVVSLVDLPATYVDLAGVRPGLRLDGRSLLARQWRDTTLVQTGRTVLQRDVAAGWASRGVLTDRYVYGFRAQRPSQDFLYDHATDPHELENVADRRAYRRVRAELRSRARALLDCRGGACSRTFGTLPEPG